MSYRPDLDGLRAIAVLAVVFYHAHLGFPGGYVGVDIFFVLSGFLITGLLLRDLETGRFSLAAFWTRRVRRLLPALLVVTVVTALGSAAVLLPDDLKDLGRALIAHSLLLVNVYFWLAMPLGYFGDPAETRPLLHTWSLGVEEQFYMLFPLLLLLLYRLRLSRAAVAGSLAVLALASLLLCGWLTPRHHGMSYFLLPTRAWELLLGGLLVFAPAPRHRLTREVLAWGGLGLCAVAMGGLDRDTPFPGWFALLPCLGAAALLAAHAGEGPSLLRTALSWGPLRQVGLMSYSLYLWHWPVMAWAGYLDLTRGLGGRWLVVLLSGVLGALSWRLVETPFRQGPALASPLQAWRAYLLYLLLSLSLGLLFRQTSGLLQGWSPDAQSLFASRYEVFTLGNLDPDPPPATLPTLGVPRGPRHFLLWGDSHAMGLAPMLSAAATELGVGGTAITRGGTPPLVRWRYASHAGNSSPSPQLEAKWSELALATTSSQGYRMVLLVARWDAYAWEGFADALEETVQAFQSQGLEVVFVTGVPLQPFHVPRRLALATRWSGLDTQPLSLAEHQGQNAHVREALERLQGRPGFTVIDPMEVIGGWRSLASEGRCLYRDDNHLSELGAQQLRPLFRPIFEEWSKQSVAQPAE